MVKTGMLYDFVTGQSELLLFHRNWLISNAVPILKKGGAADLLFSDEQIDEREYRNVPNDWEVTKSGNRGIQKYLLQRYRGIPDIKGSPLEKLSSTTKKMSRATIEKSKSQHILIYADRKLKPGFYDLFIADEKNNQ